MIEDEQQRHQVFSVASVGLSIPEVCKVAQVSLFEFWDTYENDEGFRLEFERASKSAKFSALTALGKNEESKAVLDYLAKNN